MLDVIDKVVNQPWFNFSFTEVANLSDKIYLNVISEPTGIQNEVDLKLKAWLTQYPTSQPSFI